MENGTPIPAATLAEMYDSPAAYDDAYEQAADAAITAGFVLDDHRASLIDAAPPLPDQG